MAMVGVEGGKVITVLVELLRHKEEKVCVWGGGEVCMLYECVFFKIGNSCDRK